MSWDQYSEIPASNYISGYFLTGMAPSSVKVAGSDIMADLASRFAAMHTSGGSANAQTVTQTRQWAALINGLELIFLPGNANTGPTTLAVDGLVAKNIFAYGAALNGGELATNTPAHVKYDGTQFNLLNPNSASGITAITLSGMASGGTGNLNWRILHGHFVSLWSGAGITGTSNATTCTFTLPAFLSAAATQNFNSCSLQDNGSNGAGGLFNIAGTTVTLGKTAPSAGGFTASGGKGLSPGFLVVFVI